MDLKMRTQYFLYLIMGVVLFSACVDPQRFDSLENRVAAMEMENNRQLSRQKQQSVAIERKLQQDLEKLENKVDQDDSISREEYAELRDDFQILKTDMQQIAGKIEEIEYQFAQFSKNETQGLEKKIEQLDHAISKNFEKLIRLEKYMGFEPSSGTQTAAEEAATDTSEGGSEQGLYNLAKKLLDNGEKENARIQFENFINKYPDSDNADNARFWIADSYYSEKWFEKAILEYQKVLEQYPDSNKLAAARLKQGYAFAELGENANARLILKELIKKYPDSKEADYAQKKIKKLN